MKTLISATATILALSVPAFAEGDAEAGEKAFKKCKSCHMIASADETFVKGGKTGPNLHGVVGRVAGSVEDYKYGKGLAAANEAGMVWSEDELVAFMTDPKAWLEEQGYEKKTKMSFKLKKGGEDVAAYLATFSDG